MNARNCRAIQITLLLLPVVGLVATDCLAVNPDKPVHTDPVWQEPWLIGLILLLFGGIGLQTGRLIRRDRRLKELGRILTRDRSAERVLAEGSGMKQSRDIVNVVAALWEGLKDCGVKLELLAISVPDPDADVFLFYGATGLPQDLLQESLLQANIVEGVHLWQTEVPLSIAEEREWTDMAAGTRAHEFRVADEEYLDFLKAIWGEVWERPEIKASILGRHMLGVSFTNGMLGISGEEENEFSERDLEVLLNFGDALSLGYTRYFDLRRMEAQNERLTVEAALERVRAQVQSMQQASDFQAVLSILAKDLKTVGLSFSTCGIDVLDEPVDEPTMAYFEEHGFRYTAYTIHPDGTVVSNPYHIPAPFPPVNLETIKRFIAGEPWQGRSQETAIVEVPAAGYGRLRLTVSDRREFTREQVKTLQEFAFAIAMGYARYQDFKQLEERNQALDKSNRTLEQTLRQLRETQDQLVMKEKMASLGKLVAGVAHEINNPVGAVNSSVETAGRCTDKIQDALDEGEAKETTGAIGKIAQILKVLRDNTRNALTAGKRIAQVVESLKNFARLDEAQYQKVDLHRGLDSTLTLQQHELQDRVRVIKSYGDIPAIYCFASELNQVFMNLVVNAIQSIEGQGTIHIETSSDSDYVSVRISDTGKGITSENLDQIFDPGFTTWGSGVGTGLGLSTAYNVLQKHGGKIEVESQAGKGSVFTVLIPVVETAG